MVTFNKNNETLLLLIIPSLKQVLMCLKLFFSVAWGHLWLVPQMACLT